MPRRRRETMTRQVSSVGKPTSRKPVTSPSTTAPPPSSARHERGDHEPEWHAAASPRKIRAGEPGCGAGSQDRRRTAPRFPPPPRRRREPAQHAGSGRDDARHRARRAVHVVEQVERVDHSPPKRRSHGVNLGARTELPAEPERRQQHPDHELGRHPQLGRQRRRSSTVPTTNSTVTRPAGSASGPGPGARRVEAPA